MQIDQNLIRSMMQARQQQGPGGGMNYLSQQMAQGSGGQLGGLAGRLGQALQQRAMNRPQQPGGQMPLGGGMPAQGGPMIANGVINAKRPMMRQPQGQPGPMMPPPERGGMGPAGY